MLMKRKIIKISKKAGLPPGALIHVGEKKATEAILSYTSYNESEYIEDTCSSTAMCPAPDGNKKVLWLNLDGLHDVDLISDMGKKFNLHHLLLEDVLNTHHRPKMEEFDNYLFFTLKHLEINKKDQNLSSQQISLVLGKDYVLTFRESETNIFQKLRERIKISTGSIRKKGPDYLFYRLLDIIVDNYFGVIEHIDETSEQLEENALMNPTKETLQQIRHYKNMLAEIRKSVLPLREAISSLLNNPGGLIDNTTQHYIRDVYEHIIQIVETVEAQKDTLTTVMELYLTGLSNKTNDVMKVLTIIATIFIPLTFIAGIYGMNFDNMPELHWKYGYFVVWGIMIFIILIMIVFFKRKKWL